MSTAAMLEIYHSNRLETLADALALVTERPVPGRADRGAISRVNTGGQYAYRYPHLFGAEIWVTMWA